MNRRDFLKGSLAGTGAAITGVAKSSELPKVDTSIDAPSNNSIQNLPIEDVYFTIERGEVQFVSGNIDVQIDRVTIIEAGHYNLIYDGVVYINGTHRMDDLSPMTLFKKTRNVIYTFNVGDIITPYPYSRNFKNIAGFKL
jgi:hypothetical protein